MAGRVTALIYSALASASQSFESPSCAEPFGNWLTALLHELAAWERASFTFSLPLSSALVAESPTDLQAASRASPEAPPMSFAWSVQDLTAEVTESSALEVDEEVLEVDDEALDEESSSSPHPTASNAQTATAGMSEVRINRMAQSSPEEEGYSADDKRRNGQLHEEGAPPPGESDVEA